MANLARIILIAILFSVMTISITACARDTDTSEPTTQPTPTVTPTATPVPTSTPVPDIEPDLDPPPEAEITFEQMVESDFEPRATEYEDFQSLISGKTLLLNSVHETYLGYVQVGDRDFLDIIGLYLSGAISYKIADFDNDGQDELLLVTIDSYLTEWGYESKLFVYMFEIIDGIVTVVDNHILLDEPLFADTSDWADIFVIGMDGYLNVVVEREGLSELFVDGFTWEMRVLSYSNNRFHEVVHMEFSGSDWEDRNLAEIQKELSDFGIITDYRAAVWWHDVNDGLVDFDDGDGRLFTRFTRHNQDLRVICIVTLNHDITWYDIYEYNVTGELPSTSPIRIHFD